jgi:RHS repeat-associated protein
MYQPTLGRFLSRDPLSANGVDVLTDTGFYGDRLAAMRANPWYYGGNWENPYVYAKNNPTNLVDPSGLQADSITNAIRACMQLPPAEAITCLNNLLADLPEYQQTLATLRAKLQLIIKCEATNAAYKALDCKGCTDPTITAAEAKKRAACLTAEIAARSLYLKNKCDYVLPGSCARGSQAAEKGHKQQVAQKTLALTTCLVKATAK